MSTRKIERDIVERLRKWEDRRGNVTPGELMDEAAAEIERLRHLVSVRNRELQTIADAMIGGIVNE